MNFQSLFSKNVSDTPVDLHIESTVIPGDLETPVSAYLKLRNHGAKFLLESAESSTMVGRFSFIGMKPESKIIVTRDNFCIEDSTGSVKIPLTQEETPFSILKTYFNRHRLPEFESQPRLLGGAVGYISYDYIRFFENIPDLSSDNLNLPLAMFHIIDTLLVFDHLQRRITILCLTDRSDIELAKEKISMIRTHLLSPLALPKQDTGDTGEIEPKSNFTKEEFCKAVEQVKKHIRAGDVYQQVISQRLEGTTASDPFNIFRALRMLNPSPYMYFLDFDDLILIGSSPEAMVRLEKGVATVRPIAGTRPRGKNEQEDDELSRELIADEKERAEHVMLVDLGRNDLGRCCEIGSIKVTEFMINERYSHVMHLTSNVIGKLKPELDQFDLFKATFPAGTVTGAPKIKAMQLIEEIENLKRGPYAGAAGYFSLSGDSDWCINIRSITMKGNTYYLQAGAGIVADSVPENEYVETKNKIAALKKAIEMAERGLS